MISLNQRYEQMLATLQRHERIFVYRGVPNANNDGGWIKKPMMDPDYNYQIPMLRARFVRPNQTQLTIEQWRAEGWHLYEPEPQPEGIRPAPRVEPQSQPEQETTSTKPRSRKRKSKS